jgi:hypothetical protein
VIRRKQENNSAAPWQKARRCRFLIYDLQARLGLAEIQMRTGQIWPSALTYVPSSKKRMSRDFCCSLEKPSIATRKT